MGIMLALTYKFSSVDEGRNSGFTPRSSFENDVMSITLMNKLQFDNS